MAPKTAGWMKAAALGAGVLLGTSAAAAGQTLASGKQAGQTQARVLDVQELNRNLRHHAGQKVSVAGEIQERVDGQSFVLESGGIFNDEILVVTHKDTQVSGARLVEDADIVVTGTLRATPIVEVERELGWDFDMRLETELDGTRTFLIAERIQPQTP